MDIVQVLNNNDQAVLYLRLSKEDIDKLKKGDYSESIENQRLLLTEYAIEQGFKIVDIYIDDDYSGLYDDRPGFERLIRDSKLGKFNTVIAKSQSRFTRNMEHMEKYLHHDFPLLGIRFIGLIDGVDTALKGNKKARQIYGLTNEWYCEDLSENIRTVFKHKMKDGQFLGGFAPYGYLKNPNDKHKFIIDEEAANVVRRIFHLYIQGFSVNKICHILEDDFIPNPTVYKKQQGLTYANVKAKDFSEKYNLWSPTTIRRIISNETYIGKLIQGTCEKLSYKDKKIVPIPKENWIVVENHHEPIIEIDLFKKAKSLSEKRRIVAPNQTGDKKVHVLAGKIRCESCGSTMIKSGGVRGNSSDWYLRCQLANKSRLSRCTSHNILYSVVENTTLESIQQLVYPVLNEKVKNGELENYLLQTTNNNDQIKSKTKLLKELQDKASEGMNSLKLLYTDRVNGKLTEDIFTALKDNIESEYETIQQQIQKINKELEDLSSEQHTKKNFQKLIGKYCDYSKLTHEMVADFIECIQIGEKDKESSRQEVTIHWNL